MRTALTEMFNIEAPIFAFTHCRDVVVEVSKSGGFGVLGATRFTPKQLETELSSCRPRVMPTNCSKLPSSIR